MDRVRTLEDYHYRTAADLLLVETAVIRAVAQVEAGPHGAFLDTGEPTILFERHIFSRQTQGRFDESHPDLSNPTPGGYGSVSAQHGRLARAVELDREAGLKSASYGLFQIMGFNHIAAGHPTLQGFINSMYASALEHLLAMVRFCQFHKLDRHLRNKDWAAFARGFNGPAFRRNRYSEKLEAAYKSSSIGGL